MIQNLCKISFHIWIEKLPAQCVFIAKKSRIFVKSRLCGIHYEIVDANIQWPQYVAAIRQSDVIINLSFKVLSMMYVAYFY